MDGKTYEYSYVALTEKLSRETTPTASGEETVTRSYDYNSDLERLGQTRKLGTQASSFRVYGADAVGSVEQLENEDGSVGAGQTYKYDPYGDLTNQSAVTGIAAEAPFRFEGFYYDPASQTYDMQARTYRPAQARFLSQDRYEAASGIWSCSQTR